MISHDLVSYGTSSSVGNVRIEILDVMFETVIFEYGASAPNRFLVVFCEGPSGLMPALR